MDIMTNNYLKEVLDNYFTVLGKSGYISYNDVFKILLLRFIRNSINNNFPTDREKTIFSQMESVIEVSGFIF